MKVSIVTVCFHSEKTNADTLKSLSARTHHEIEHIMIDGGSRDPTRAMVPDHGDRIASVVSELGDEI